MDALALVALGGALGAISRYAVDRAVFSAIGPTVLGTFLINISGSFLLGLFVSLVSERAGWWSLHLRMLIAVGFLGSYTTFSTLTVASVQLFSDGDAWRGALNILGSLLVGLTAAFLGILAGKAL